MKFSREQYIELMTFGNSERPMFSELMGLLIGLNKEWKAQGATPEELNFQAFDWDYTPSVLCGGNTGPIILHEPITLEENDEHLIQHDGLSGAEKPAGID